MALVFISSLLLTLFIWIEFQMKSPAHRMTAPAEGPNSLTSSIGSDWKRNDSMGLRPLLKGRVANELPSSPSAPRGYWISSSVRSRMLLGFLELFHDLENVHRNTVHTS